MTKRLVACGELIGITVLDHVILGKETYLSMKEANYDADGKKIYNEIAARKRSRVWKEADSHNIILRGGMYGVSLVGESVSVQEPGTSCETIQESPGRNGVHGEWGLDSQSRTMIYLFR